MTTSTSEPPQTAAVKTLEADTQKPPKPTRVGTAAAVRDRIGELRRMDQTRSDRRAILDGLLDGARPWDQAKLNNTGQRDRTNVNWREAEGMLASAVAPYYGMLRNSCLARVETDWGENASRRGEWSDKISKCFHKMLKNEWGDHDFNVQLRDNHMCWYGIGFAMFPDDKTPFWEARQRREILVPDRVKSNIRKLPEMACSRKINPVDLYRMIEKEASAKTMGWFPERVKEAIIKYAPTKLQTQNSQNSQWNEEYQASLRRGDIMWNGDECDISVLDYFVKEFNGKITHCIILDDGSPVDEKQPFDPTKDDDSGFLFRKIGRYDNFTQVLVPFFFDIGRTGEWDSVKGLGTKVADFCRANNRTLCKMLDGVGKAATLLLKAADGASLQETQLIEIAGQNFLPPGWDVAKNDIGPGLNGVREVRQELSNTMQNNIGQYSARTPLDKQEATLGQAQLNKLNEQALTETAMDRHGNSLDMLYCEQFRRASKLGLEMYHKRKKDETYPPELTATPMQEAEEACFYLVKELIDYQGVPEEAIKFENICSVRATRGVGSGSPVGMDIATRGGMELLPVLNPKGQNVVKRMRLSFLFGDSRVDEIEPPFDEMQMPGDQEQEATNENNFLKMPTGEVLVSVTDDDAIHIPYHIGSAFNSVEQLQAGQLEPMAAQVHLTKAGEHVKRHLDKMAGDPSRETAYKQFEQAWNMMGHIADQLNQQIQEAAKAQAANQQAQPPQPDPEMMAQMAKIQGDLQLKAMKMKGDMALKAEKQDQQMALKDKQVSQSMFLKLAQTMGSQAAA